MSCGCLKYVQLFVDPNHDPDELNAFRNQWTLSLLTPFFAIWGDDKRADVTVWIVPSANVRNDKSSSTLESKSS